MSFSTFYPRDNAMRAFTGLTVTVHAPLPPQVDMDGYVLPPMYLCSLSDGSTLEAYADELGGRPAPAPAYVPLPKTPCYCDFAYHPQGC